MKILLTGDEGMLAQDFLSVLDQFPEFECYVPPRKELDITNQEQVEGIIKNYRPDILLNCAPTPGFPVSEEQGAVHGNAMAEKTAAPCPHDLDVV